MLHQLIPVYACMRWVVGPSQIIWFLLILLDRCYLEARCWLLQCLLRAVLSLISSYALACLSRSLSLRCAVSCRADSSRTLSCHYFPYNSPSLELSFWGRVIDGLDDFSRGETAGLRDQGVYVVIEHHCFKLKGPSHRCLIKLYIHHAYSLH